MELIRLSKQSNLMTQHVPLFSVVIPAFNRSELIRLSIDTVLNQTFTNYEIIVVDDGSTDNTADVVRSYGDRVRLIEKANGGCASARNIGAQAAKGCYLAFFDSDDLFLPKTLEIFESVMHAANGPAIVCGRLQAFKGTTPNFSDYPQDHVEKVTYPDFHAAGSAEKWALGVAHTVIRRDVYLEAGGCEERDINWTDSDVLFKAGCAEGCVVLRNPVTLMYREHAGATTRNFKKGLAGARFVIGQEKSGRYPGGPRRALERCSQITQRTRALSSLMISGDAPGLAMRLYLATLPWNLRLGRWRYLAALPLAALFPALRHRLPTSNT